MTARLLGDSGHSDGVFDRALKHRFMEVVTAPVTGPPIPMEARRREYPLPTPFPGGSRIFSVEGVRKPNAARLLLQVILVLSPHSLHVLSQWFLDLPGKKGYAVLLTLTVPDQDLVPGKVDILDPKASALHQPQTRTIQKGNHQPRCPMKLVENRVDFLASQNDRQANGLLCSDHARQPFQLPSHDLPVKEEERTEGLVLCGSTHPLSDGKVGEKCGDFVLAHVAWVALAVEDDKPPDPLDVSLLCARAVVPDPDGLADLVQEAWGLVVVVEALTDHHRRNGWHVGSHRVGEITRKVGTKHEVRPPEIKDAYKRFFYFRSYYHTNN